MPYSLKYIFQEDVTCTSVNQRGKGEDMTFNMHTKS